MFGFFDYPYYDPLDEFFGYRYNRPRRVRPQYYPVQDYFSTIEDRLNQVLREEFGLDPQYHVDIQQRAKQLQQQCDKDAQDHSETKQKVEKEAREDNNNDTVPPPPPQQRTPPARRQPYQQYYYQSRSTYDGNNYVEEHREKVTDIDGKVHMTTRRRLGDRWYEAESVTDENGKQSSKETWHNVPEDQIENFKLEWSQQHGNKYGNPDTKKPIENKSEEPKKD